MISNQQNERMRLYGPGERASSTSSAGGGPKWTSSIQDLLMNRQGNMRSGVPVSQSHQTSQHQLLSHVAAPASTGHGQSSSITQAQAAHIGSEGGSRLMTKLMNIGAHHSSGSNANIGSAQTFDHPRLSGSRDDQKRLALDDATNFLQQKTMQQHFPSTSQAISNIINSNRSASSAGIQIPGTTAAGGVSSTSTAAKKFQAFKFNLTLNKNKPGPIIAHKGANDPAPPQNFYQQNVLSSDNQPPNRELEDNDAIVINEKHRKQMQAMSRGGSTQLAMKQHLKQMIKSYEDQQQPIGLSSTTGNPLIDNTQRFDQPHYHETQQFDQQFTYDNTYRQGQLHGLVKQSTSPPPPNPNMDKKVNEMEERQKIFEEEIIKRVKEIQNYAKTLHMHLKKLQQSHTKRTEELQSAKELIMSVKDTQESMGSGLTDQLVADMIEKRLKLLDNEVNRNLDHLEQRLTKDLDSKLMRQVKQNQSDLQLTAANIKDEILGQVMQELQVNVKQDIVKSLNERMKESQRTSERANQEVREVLNEKSQIIEEIINEQQNIMKEVQQRNEKLQKNLKDQQLFTEDSINALGETLRSEMEQLKKKLTRDIKSDIDQRQYASINDLQDQNQLFENKLAALLSQVNAKQSDTSTALNNNQKIEALEERLQQQLQELEEDFRAQRTQQSSIEDKVKSIQEAMLQVKSHQASSSQDFQEKLLSLDTDLKQLAHSQAKLYENFDELKGSQTPSTQQQTQVVDNDQIAQDVLYQIDPQLHDLTAKQEALQTSVDTIKQQLSQKLMRSELQEMKQDIDAEIKSLEKFVKKQEERTQQNEALIVKTKEDLNQLDSEYKANNTDIQERLSSNHEQTEAKFKLISDSVQSKTNDLFDSIEEIQEKLASGVLSSISEPSPERKSKSDALSALRATIDLHVEEYQRYQVELNTNLEQLQEQISSLTENEELQEQVTVLGNRLQSVIQSQVSESTFETLKTQVTDVCTSHKEFKESIDEQLDLTIAKVNDLDARIAQIEEKDHKSIIITEEDKPEATSSSKVAQHLKQQLEIVQMQMTSKFETLTVHSKEIEYIQLALNELQDYKMKSQEKQEQNEGDIQFLKELCNCIQDVQVTKDEMAEKLKQNDCEIGAKLEELYIENQTLASRIEELQAEIQKPTFVSRIPDQDNLNGQQEIIRQTLSELRVNLNQLIAEQDDKIASLEQSNENKLSDLEMQLTLLNNKFHDLQSRGISLPNHADPQRRSLGQPITSARGQQPAGSGLNFLTTPRGYETQHSPEQDDGRQSQQQYQGHFLENLSEVISSPNPPLHGAEGGDLMIFNNRSRQSISSSSMLMTPIQNRALHFQFNSQTQGVHEHHPNEILDNQSNNQQPDEEEEKTNEQVESPISQRVKTNSVKSLPHVVNIEEESKSEENHHEINVTIESPRVVEDRTPDRTTSGHNKSGSHSRERHSSSVKRQQHPEEQIQDSFTGLPANQSADVDPLEQQLERDLENTNVEEVLQDLRDVSEDHQQEMASQHETEEEVKENEASSLVDGQEAEEDLENEVEIREESEPALLSPVNNHHVASNQHHHSTHLQQQHQHLVAFESDEEDSIQYDLLPINQSHRVGGSVVHPNSSAGGVIPTGAVVDGESSSRNRYYESGSGGEHDEDVIEGELDDPFGQELQINININDIGEPNQPQPVQQVQEDDFRPQQMLIQDEEDVEEDENQDQGSDFNDDGAPFDARPSSRLEEEKRSSASVSRRESPLSSTQFQHQQEPLDQEDPNPNFQDIHHETLSSHPSERSGRLTQRSGSLNIDHNNDNIDENGQDDLAEFQNDEPPVFDRALSEQEEEEEEEEPEEVHSHRRSSHLEQHLGESDVNQNEVEEENKTGASNEDDWNFEEMDIYNDKQEKNKVSKEPCNEIEEEEVKTSQSPAKSSLSEALSNQPEKMSEIIANIIVEQEILKSIEAAMMVKNGRIRQM